MLDVGSICRVSRLVSVSCVVSRSLTACGVVVVVVIVVSVVHSAGSSPESCVYISSLTPWPC